MTELQQNVCIKIICWQTTENMLRKRSEIKIGEGTMKGIKKLLSYVTKVEYAIMIVAFVTMVAAYFVAVVNRNFIKASMPWTEEVAMYSMIYMALLGTEVGLRDGTQVAVTAIIEKLHRTTKKVISILKDSAKSSAMILFIIAASTAFSWVFTFSGASQALVNAVISMHLNSALFCFVVAIILLIFGTFMEGTAIAVLLVPVLWPIAQSMGIDVIHFGMIVCISNVVGTMTPPVAVNIFSASTVSGLKMGDIAKAEIPFLIGYVAVFFCCVFSETFCTFLI